MAYNNLNEYYTANGGANTWNSPTRTNDARRAGIQNYTGTADQNGQLLSYLTNASATNPVATPRSTYVQNVASSPAANSTPTWLNTLNAVLPNSTPAPISSPYSAPHASNMSTNNGPVYNPPPVSTPYNQSTAGSSYIPPPNSTPYNQSTAGSSYIAPPSVSTTQSSSGIQTGLSPASTYVQNRAAATPPQYAGGTATTPPATPQAPLATPQAPAGPTAADTAFAEYLKSLTETDEERTAKKELNTLQTDAQLANERALNSGETLGFAGGEAQRVNRNNDIRIAGASAYLDALSGQRSNVQSANKARYEYEQSKIEGARDANPAFELSPGQERWTYNTKTGQYEKTASAAQDPLDAVYRQAQIDNIYADNARQASGGGAVPAGTTRSGGLVYTPQNAGEDSRELEGTRGSDGYVDPTTYQAIYEEWVGVNGGLLKDFLAKFPPEKYVNPANTWLPKYLMPKSTGREV